MKHRFSILAVGFILLCACGRGETTDPFNNKDFLTAPSNMTVTANGTARMTNNAPGNPVVNWREQYALRLRNHSDRVEVDPVAPIGAGKYSLGVRFYNSARQFLTEIEWAGMRSDLTTQVLESVAQLAAEHSVSNAEFYWIRFHLYGAVGEGFEFDEIRVLNGPGYWPSTVLLDSAPKAVLGHMMTGFRTPFYSGDWSGWGYSNDYVSHNPAFCDPNGRPDIASTDYPLVGYYDMKDPKLIEYQCQSLKMACMDGVIFDLGFCDPDNAEMMNSYLTTLSDYGLKGVICYEDKVHWIWDDSATTRAMALQRAYEDMNQWLSLFLSSGTAYMATDSRPLFLLFSYEDVHPAKGVTCLLPQEIDDWLDTFDANYKPVLMRQRFQNPDYVGILNGRYTWPEFYAAPPGIPDYYTAYCDLAGNYDYLYAHREEGQYLISQGLADFHISSVWPGFHDLAIWGWGKGPRLMPRYNGQLYQQTWQWAIDDDLPVLQIATWNDWYEETMIEPSVRYGGTYLQLTSQRAAEFKGLTNWNVPDVNVPVWIYRIRDITTDPLVLQDLEAACEAIRAGDFSQAESLVAPWAAYFQVDAVTYWTGPDSIQTAPVLQAPSGYAFEDVEYGNSAAAVLQVTNTGTQPLQFTGPSPVEFISGQEHFSVVPAFDTEDLYVSRSRNLSVVFAPQSVGLHSGILRISTNDPAIPTTYVTIEGRSVYKEGDWNHDGSVDMKDFNSLSLCWLESCGLSDLAVLAEKWLD